MATRVLIGMLCCGENEQRLALAALERQRYTNWELRKFEGMQNKEAHDALYAYFMGEAQNFSHFLKLDADMVFRRDTALDEMLALFGAHPDCDWLMLEVHDWYSDTLIPAIQMFSNRARWPTTADALIVDTKPQIDGRALRVWQAPAPVVDHSPDPSPLQAFRFGVHRMIKALQPDRPPEQRSPHRAFTHWTILDYAWRHFRQSGDRRLALALAGAEFVMREGSAHYGHAYTSPHVLAAFHERFEPLGPEALVEFIGNMWDAPLMNQTRWIQKFAA